MPSSSTRPTGGSSGAASTATPTASSTRSCRLPTTTSAWRPTGRCRTPTTTCAPSSRPCRRRWRPPAWTPRRSSAWASTSRPARCCPPRPTARPSASLPELRREPHAWVKLWKHHAAQPEADRINAVARERGEAWLPRYGGKISSEWFFSKALQILDEAPDVYDAADRLIEAADWVIWQLTGVETRNSCTAGYKAIWSKQDGFPSARLLRGARPAPGGHRRREDVARRSCPSASKAGGLTEEAAAWTGLRPGTAVAVANVDAHVSVPAATVTEPGRMVMVMGTSICHMVWASRPPIVEGMCGVVEDGILPGLFGYEAGQSAVGDIFAWFVDNLVPPAYHRQAEREGVDVHTVLEREAARLAPGQSGLVALDWWNGNRSILVDVDLSGLLLGATLATTRAGDLPRAHRGHRLRHAHDRRVLRGLRRARQRHRRLRRPAGAQPAAHADLRRRHEAARSPWRPRRRRRPSARPCGRPWRPARRPAATTASRTPQPRMARLRDERYEPDPARAAVYDELYAEYRTPARLLRSRRPTTP